MLCPPEYVILWKLEFFREGGAESRSGYSRRFQGYRRRIRYIHADRSELWLEMMGKRNLLAHTYDAKLAEEAYQLIANKYFKPLKELVRPMVQQPATSETDADVEELADW